HTAGARGRTMVLRLLLHTPRGLLCATTAARPDGHRRRCQSPTMDVHCYLRDAARGAAALWCAGLQSDAGALHSRGLPLFRRQPGPVLAAADRWRCDSYRGARLLCLGERVQLICRRGVLVIHGDLFTSEQGKRLFGFIGAGGTAGSLVGPAVTI